MILNVISTDTSKSFGIEFNVTYITEIGMEIGGIRNRMNIYNFLCNHTNNNVIWGFCNAKFKKFLLKNGITFDNFDYMELVSEPVNGIIKKF